LVVARDGGLALPPIEGLRSDQAAVEFFNRCLAALLIGGVYCEAVTPDGLDIGSIIDWRYVRSHRAGQAAPNRFHLQVRYGHAPPLEAIALSQPRTVTFAELTTAMATGLDVLGRVPALRGEYFLKGVTGIARRDWGSALSNLWIVSEQILSELWRRYVVTPTLTEDSSKGRKDQLNDTRTWTASARIEMLYQTRCLKSSTVEALTTARRARNGLSHEGKHPSEPDAQSAYRAVCELLAVALDGECPPLFALDLSNHALSDPFAPPTRVKLEPTHWMEIPKLPGELDLERLEAAQRRGPRNRQPT